MFWGEVGEEERGFVVSHACGRKKRRPFDSLPLRSRSLRMTVLTSIFSTDYAVWEIVWGKRGGGEASLGG